MTITAIATERRITCRYLKPTSNDQCTAEAANPDGAIILCIRHLALAAETIRDQAASMGVNARLVPAAKKRAR